MTPLPTTTKFFTYVVILSAPTVLIIGHLALYTFISLCKLSLVVNFGWNKVETRRLTKRQNDVMHARPLRFSPLILYTCYKRVCSEIYQTHVCLESSLCNTILWVYYTQVNQQIKILKIIAIVMGFFKLSTEGVKGPYI